MKSPCIITIIVTHNGSTWIDRTLDSLNASNTSHKIVVVDNDSSDDTLVHIRLHPEVHLISLKNNIGFGRANNIGINYAMRNDADFIFLLNQDAHITPNTLDELINLGIRYPEYGIISPVHYNGSGSEFDRGFISYMKSSNIAHDIENSSNIDKNIYPVNFVNAAAWLVSRKCIEVVGGFDPLFFMYGEDDDYCARVHFHGFLIGVAPRAIIYHDRGDRKYGTKSWRDVRGASMWTYSRIVRELKRVSIPFHSNIRSVLYCIVEGRVKRDSTLNFFAIVAILRAIFSVLFMIGKIYKHYKISSQQGMHWIIDNTEIGYVYL